MTREHNERILLNEIADQLSGERCVLQLQAVFWDELSAMLQDRDGQPHDTDSAAVLDAINERDGNMIFLNAEVAERLQRKAQELLDQFEYRIEEFSLLSLVDRKAVLSGAALQLQSSNTLTFNFLEWLWFRQFLEENAQGEHSAPWMTALAEHIHAQLPDDTADAYNPISITLSSEHADTLRGELTNVVEEE